MFKSQHNTLRRAHHKIQPTIYHLDPLLRYSCHSHLLLFHQFRTTMTSNHATFQPAEKAPKLQVSDAPYPRASDGQIVVRAAALAINPIDWMIQERGDFFYTHLKYPFTLGYDMAGQVVETGKGVTRFRVGDRVSCFCIGGEKEVNTSSKSAFQQFVLVDQDQVSENSAGGDI